MSPIEVNNIPKPYIPAYPNLNNWQQSRAQISPAQYYPQIPRDSVRFVALGDWGSGQQAEYQVANAMSILSRYNPFQFVITLGDNFYPEKLGIPNVNFPTGKLFNYQFLEPFKNFLTQNPSPWYASLGNHDKGLENDVKQLFKMPADFYTYKQGPIQFFVLNTNQFNPQQAKWLDEQLKTSSSKWKVVYGHHPPFTSGSHGSNAHLIQNLVPILERNKVDLYLSGHEHGYERLDKINGVQYIISGGGGGSITQNIFTGWLPQSKVRASLHHFLTVDANQNQLNIKAITPNLRLLDELNLHKPQTNHPNFRVQTNPTLANTN